MSVLLKIVKFSGNFSIEGILFEQLDALRVKYLLLLQKEEKKALKKAIDERE